MNNLNNLFITSIFITLAAYLVQAYQIGTPWVGLVVWTTPMVFFGVRAALKPSRRLFQVCAFFLLIYFMGACLAVFGPPTASTLDVIQLSGIVVAFLATIFQSKYLQNVK